MMHRVTKTLLEAVTAVSVGKFGNEQIKLPLYFLSSRILKVPEKTLETSLAKATY